MTIISDTHIIQQLYITYFQRPGDPMGLAFWENALESFPVAAVSGDFAKSVEYRALIDGKNHGDVVDALYLNLFGRHADSAGLEFYRNALDTGKTTVELVAADILQGATAGDFEIKDNRVVAAQLFSKALEIDPLNMITYALNTKSGKDFVAGVTDDASLYAALAKLPNLMEVIVSLMGADAQATVAAPGIGPVLNPPLNNEDRVQQLFVAYFKRPATTAELSLWSETMASTSMEAVSRQLAQTREYTDSVKDLDSRQVIDRLYMNLFGRHGDDSGLKFYGDVLSSDALKIDQLVGAFIDGARGNDLEVLGNRMLGAELFTTALDINSALSVYYALHQEPGKAFLDGVTGDTSLFQALRALPKVLQEMDAALQTPTEPVQLIANIPVDPGAVCYC